MPERPKFDSQTLKRLLSYMRAYKGTLVLVTVCILLSAVAGAASSMFLQKLIDGYIVPMLGTASPDYSGLIRALITIGCVYLVGTLATWLYNRRMVTIAQGTLKRIRDEMFEKMQSLPIRYFDTHTHGDIMSLYTNDTDTLRQMIAQSMAQLVSSVFTLAAVFFCMLYISIWLTLIVCAVMALILVFVRKLTGRIGGYFMAQQTALADLNGYVEEMVNGQKVVKVFCHEGQSKAELRRRNRVWAENAARASGMANSMMPMMNAVGYLQYVIIAVIGGTMAIAGTPNLGLTGMNTLTLGMIASFLTLSRGFTNPISQISNQFNSIVTALAGASRIFAFMDAEPETDDGYVTLVNAKEENGTLAETDHHTGLWAWKHPHGDGTVTYTKLAGRVVFDHVDFGYTPDKEVLHDITLYAEPGQKVAFVGATGAGKTTITNLINRFYDIADGKIRYDGININKIRKADLRRSLGIVLQDVNLFTGTVMENIRYGNPDATDDECIAAHKAAGVEYIVVPSMRRIETLDGLATYCRYFNEVGARCKAAGIKFGYHNHSREFEKVEDRVMLDYMLENTDPDKVFFQMDVYWTVMGQASPVDYFTKYPGRFRLLHIKDRREVGQSGMVGYDAIFCNAATAGVENIIVEMEGSSYGDVLRSVRECVDYLNEAPFVEASYAK